MNAFESSSDPLIGRTLSDGKYRIDALLGSGSMGVVYKAEHVDLERTVAIKIVTPHLLSFEKAAARFRREARAASLLTHRNIVRVTDFGSEDKLHYIVMEFLDGLSLADYLDKKRQALPLDEIVEIMEQVFSGLAAAHDKGILHRDIKPENIYLVQGVDEDGMPRLQVKLCDFGIAKMLDRGEAGHRAPSLTGMGEVLGTPEYMAPEQASSTTLDQRTDLYACGVLMYLLGTGKLPFQGDSVVNLIMQHVSNPPPKPSSHNPGINPRLEAIILRTLEKEPDARFQSARELRSEMRSLVGAAERNSGVFALAVLHAQSTEVPADKLPVEAFAPTHPGLTNDFKERIRTGRSSLPDIDGEGPTVANGMAYAPEDGPTVADAFLPTEDLETLRESLLNSSSALASLDEAEFPTVADGAAPAAAKAAKERASGAKSAFKVHERSVSKTVTPTPAEPSPPAPRSNSALVAVLAVIALAAVAVSIYALTREPESSADSEKPSAPADTPRSFAVDSVPTGARVLIDNVERGVTPMSFELEPGASNTLILQKRGYKLWHKPITASDEGGVVSAQLERAPVNGSLVVNTTPAGATVTVDSDPTARKSPAVVSNLWVGEAHRVVITMPGHTPRIELIRFDDDNSRTLDLELKPTRQGFIAVECSDDCTLKVNGNPIATQGGLASVDAQVPLELVLERPGRGAPLTRSAELLPGELLSLSDSTL